MKNSNIDEALLNTEFYKLPVNKVLEYIKSDQKTGLSTSEAEDRLQKFGPNTLITKSVRTVLQMTLDQLKNPLILILLFVVMVKMFSLVPKIISGGASIQSLVEVFMVLAVVFISLWIGVGQEIEAERSLDKLRSQVKFFTKVLRQSNILSISGDYVVLGDILVLEAGDRVPADCRVLESFQGMANESILTGESEEVVKYSDTIYADNLMPAEQKNMVFAGTSIVSGKIIAVVCNVGKNTEFGKISEDLESAQTEDTKFQKQTKVLLKNLTLLSLSSFVLMEILYIFILRLDPILSIETGLALVISFIPEALSAVTVIVLSVSASSLVKKGIIVKNLSAAEGMGSVSKFLTDKTGTITKGHMSTEEIWFLDGAVKAENFEPKSTKEKNILDILRFCNNSKGATEEALSKFVEKNGFQVEIFDRKYEYNYSSQTKRMTIIRESEGKNFGFVKGAGEVLLPMCGFYYSHEQNAAVELTEKIRNQILFKIEEYASSGLRVLLLAYRDYHQKHDLGNRENDEKDLVFSGLVCLMDPLREEVYDTVKKFNKSGIDLVMITGDHPNIAKYLGKKSGICEDDDEVITGSELENYITDDIKNIPTEITQKLLSTKVYARVAPKHKDFLVDFYKQNGYVVAMAGDGVNDAVAIKKANIGVAVKNAVDWVRDIAGIVVTGGFDSLIKAIEEGRKIIYRARLFSHYLLSGNISQIGIFVLISITSGKPPLTSLQLLVINLLTDTLPAVAMAYEKVPVSLMSQKPEPVKESLINKPIWISIILQGTITSLFLFWVFNSFIHKGLIYAQTAVFLAYMMQKLYRAFTARSFTQSIFEIGFFSNKMTVYSVIGSLVISYLLAWPLAQYVGMAQITVTEFGTLIVAALFIPIVEEVFKLVRRRV